MSRIRSFARSFTCPAVRRPVPPHPGRRRALAAAALLAFAPTVRPAELPEISWDDLIPHDWNPLAGLQDLLDAGDLEDDDPRARELLERMREAWDDAPVVPALEGRTGKLPGYVVPLDADRAGLREFLLVQYFGACIHTPPPPANQIVHVRLAEPRQGLRAMDAVWVSGTLGIERSDSSMGASGYSMSGRRVTPYREPGR